MKKLRALFHPIAIFVSAQISWGLFMFVWIRWYILRSEEIESLMKSMSVTTQSSPVSTVILIQGCVLMGLILISMYLMFLAFRRQSTLNKLQRNILDSVTHELKTPLASLRLHTETLLMRSLSEEDRNRFLRKSIHEIERLQKLIDGILVSSRLDSGISDSEKSDIEILPVFDLSWNRARDRVGGKRIFAMFVEKSSPQAQFRMNGNQQQLEMVFDNILDNALKYTQEGGQISVEVKISNDKFLLGVTDNGCGIEKKDSEKIFDKFFRAKSQRRHHVSGSGLGLFVCRTVVKNHGGRIYATSPGLNKGATFHVEFKRTPGSG